jgi:hypothetical protein
MVFLVTVLLVRIIQIYSLFLFERLINMSKRWNTLWRPQFLSRKYLNGLIPTETMCNQIIFLCFYCFSNLKSIFKIKLYCHYLVWSIDELLTNWQNNSKMMINILNQNITLFFRLFCDIKDGRCNFLRKLHLPHQVSKYKYLKYKKMA